MIKYFLGKHLITSTNHKEYSLTTIEQILLGLFKAGGTLDEY